MGTKAWKRIKLIGFNTVYTLSGQLSGIILSLVIISLYSDRIWGEYSSFTIWLLLPLHFSSFGNQDILLIRYSQDPRQIGRQWSLALVSRIWILFPLVLIVFFSAFHKPLMTDMILFILLRYLTQSFDSLLIYFQKFTFAVILELLRLLFSLGIILFCKHAGIPFGIDELIELFILTEALKAVLLLIFFKENLVFSGFPPGTFAFLKASLPFFSIGLAGMLGSKAGLLIANFYFDSSSIAHYQVLMNFLLLIQAGVVFLIQPFLKNIYRFSHPSVSRLIRKTSWLGLAAGAGGMAILFLILEYMYHFHFSVPVYCCSFLMVLPLYAYAPMIYYLYKLKLQHKVLQVTFASISLNILSSLLFFHYRHPDPLYLLLGEIIQHYVMLMLIWYLFSRKHKAVNIGGPGSLLAGPLDLSDDKV